MRKEDFYYDSRDNSSKIHAVKWIPEGRIAGVVQIVHGMAEYVERYEGFAEYLTQKGILVVGEDHLGHGQSVGEDGVYGYFCRQDSATVVVRDVHRLKKMIQEQYPTLPYVILGHSMGSFILRNYICRYGTGIDGAIIVGTGMPPKGLISISRLLCSVLGAFQGEKSPSYFLDKMAFGNYNAGIHNPLTDKDWLCSDETVVKKYIDDPLCGFVFTINGFRTLFELLYRLHKPENLKNMPSDLKTLFVYGLKDPVGDYGKGVDNVVKSFRNFRLTPEVICYEEGRHEVLNEKNRYDIYQDIYQWIEPFLI